MTCNPEVLKHVPLFALLDEDETAVLAGQVELKNFAPRQRIYKMGDPGGQAYVMVCGKVRVSTVDEDGQEVVVDEPAHGEFFGFASMLEQTPHQTNATAMEDTQCLEVSRGHIATLPERIADSMVQFGGSWTFIIGFLVLSSIYTAINVGMRRTAWDPYPFILL